MSSLNLSCPTRTDDTHHLHGFYALACQNIANKEEGQRESLWLLSVNLVQIHSGGSLISVFLIIGAQGCYANYTGVNLLFIMPLILLLFQQADDGEVKTHSSLC